MGICPGCGRCRECGQPAITPQVQPSWPVPMPLRPSPTAAPVRIPGPYYYVGDPIPGGLGTITVS